MTKALLGLFGSDRFRFAVSAYGSTFFDGLIIDNANGIVEQPRLPRFKGYTNYDNYVDVALQDRLQSARMRGRLVTYWRGWRRHAPVPINLAPAAVV